MTDISHLCENMCAKSKDQTMMRITSGGVETDHSQTCY